MVGICNIKFKEENRLIRLLGLHLFEQRSQEYEVYVKQQEKDIQSLNELQSLRGGMSDSTLRDIHNLKKQMYERQL